MPKQTGQPSSAARAHRSAEWIIEGWKGWALFSTALLAAAGVVVALPSMLAMVVWNALVFETFGGPQIQFYQGVLLWLMALLTIQLVFRPGFISFEWYQDERR